MQQQQSSPYRLLTSLILALVFAGTFFTFLSAVIRTPGHGPDKVEPLPTIDFVRLKRDSQVEQLQRRKPPPPPPPEPPPPPQQLKIATEAVDQAPPTPFKAPDLALGVDVGGGPVVGKLGGGGMPGGGGVFDGDIIPLQRIPPTYPSDARRAGITGWVVVEFVVNPDGSVRSAKAVEAKPRGLFDAAAISAALRWRFKPKTVNGIPVEQRGQQRIEFKLNKTG
ncbi:MAG: energy transducer TonB [Gammaproteobacteria bacterium]|nr:energy transducer TonB [Gammaproteobacteria bacterium]